jgi:hypothetical protein
VGWNKVVARRAALELLWIELAGVIIGITIGTITSSYQAPVSSLIDVGAYQNFGIITGAIVGAASYLMGTLVYILVSRRVLQHRWFHFGFFLLCSSLTGGLVSLITYLITGASGTSYGMVERTVPTVVADSIISAVLGGLFGLCAGWVLAKVRGYE